MKMKKFKSVISAILFILAGWSTTLVAVILMKTFQGNELSNLSIWFGIGFNILTISVGSLWIIKYRDAVENKRNETNWTKYDILDEKYNNFVQSNKDIISFFEWEDRFLELENLCKREIAYSQSIQSGKKIVATQEEIATIEKLDRFLDFFENLYYAVSKHIIKYDDIQIFFNYHITTLNTYYQGEKYPSFKKYVNTYYFNIKNFLEEYTSI